MATLVTVYNSIFDRIDTILDTNNQKVFKYRAIWNDHHRRGVDGRGNPFLMPSVFIEMKIEKELNLGEKVNAFDIKLTFHILHYEMDAGNGRLDENLNIFTFRDKIQKYFVQFAPTQCGPMNYIGERQNYRHDNVYEYQIDYHTHYIDTAAYYIISVTGSVLSLTYSLTQSIPIIPFELRGLGYMEIGDGSGTYSGVTPSVDFEVN